MQAPLCHKDCHTKDELEAWVFPVPFWDELLNALSMLLANLYVLRESIYIAGQSQFANDVLIIRYFSLMHCPCSMTYHITLALQSQRAGAGSDVDRSTWTRILDMGGIHVCCIAFSWALSHGDVTFVAANALVNLACVGLMLRRYALGGQGGKESEMMEYLRLGMCSFFYCSAILWRGHVAEFLRVWALLAMMGICQFCRPFGHAVSRVPLAIFVTTAMQSSAQA